MDDTTQFRRIQPRSREDGYSSPTGVPGTTDTEDSPMGQESTPNSAFGVPEGLPATGNFILPQRRDSVNRQLRNILFRLYSTNAELAQPISRAMELCRELGAIEERMRVEALFEDLQTTSSDEDEDDDRGGGERQTARRLSFSNMD